MREMETFIYMTQKILTGDKFHKWDWIMEYTENKLDFFVH